MDDFEIPEDFDPEEAHEMIGKMASFVSQHLAQPQLDELGGGGDNVTTACIYLSALIGLTAVLDKVQGTPDFKSAAFESGAMASDIWRRLQGMGILPLPKDELH